MPPIIGIGIGVPFPRPTGAGGGPPPVTDHLLLAGGIDDLYLAASTDLLLLSGN